MQKHFHILILNLLLFSVSFCLYMSAIQQTLITTVYKSVKSSQNPITLLNCQVS